MDVLDKMNLTQLVKAAKAVLPDLESRIVKMRPKPGRLSAQFQEAAWHEAIERKARLAYAIEVAERTL
jgi:hypothetical protein